MENNYTEKMLDVKINVSKEKLIRKIENLKLDLECALDMLDKNHTLNSLGIIQAQGQEIDVLCAKLGAFMEIKKVINSEK